MILFTQSLQREDDIVSARMRARDVARRLGFDASDQVRIATAVSELARHGIVDGSQSVLELAVEGASSPQLFVIRLSQRHAPGRCASCADPKALRGASAVAALPGLIGARRLMDRFDIEETPDGVAITMKQVFPRGAAALREPEQRELQAAIAQDVRRAPLSVLDEVKQQNRELAETLQQLEDRQRELSRLNAELFDTNRGVLALYAELDERAEHLRNADQLKTRFLSNMSHEFRTPLNSILALTRLLEERVDGELTSEQAKQVGFIRKSALELLEIVNDLLDLAKVEAGKIVVRPTEFSVEELFSALRGMLRPLLVGQRVALVFDDVADMPTLYSDEGKVSQVLRNFLSNALKFTESGEIRVSARVQATPEGPRAVLAVQDTGIGIAAEDLERIFEEFSQVDGPLQDKVHGTGLGLPLCRKLAQLLGGAVGVESEPGKGSRFSLSIPLRYAEASVEADRVEEAPIENSRQLVALLVEDREEDRAVIKAYLRDSPFALVATDRVIRARELLAAKNPAVVLLDISLKGEDTWRFLPEVKRAGVPVIVVSVGEDRAKGNALGADQWGTKPVSREWLRESLWRVVLQSRLKRVLLADDDAGPRTLLRVMLADYCEQIMEASDGREALELFAREGADLLITDLVMPQLSGLELLRSLREMPGGALLPALVCSSREPSTAQAAELLALDGCFLAKSDLGREAVFDTILRALGHLAVQPAGADALLDKTSA